MRTANASGDSVADVGADKPVREHAARASARTRTRCPPSQAPRRTHARRGTTLTRAPPTNFLWPQNLWLLLALPLLPALYLWLLRRPKHPLRVSSLAMVRNAAGRPWRRHVPPALLCLALALLLLTLARPTARVTLPWARTTILLAMDVSLSMRVKDVEPTCMAAAQDAARAFLNALPPTIDAGLVTFADSAQVVRQATLDRPALVRGIDAIQMQMGTAKGSAIVLCLAELFPDHHIDLGEMTFGPRSNARSPNEKAKPPPKEKWRV